MKSLIVVLLLYAGTRLAVAGYHVAPARQASLDQPAGNAPDKAARLLKTDLSLTDKDLIVTITTEGEASLSLFHVYLDSDSDSSTGYQPPSRKADEMGADYLVEGGTLHVWDGGENHAAWSWKKLDSATVGRGPAGEIQISLPLEKLKIKTSGKFRALVETLTEKWASADTLPRQGVWTVDMTGEQKAAAPANPNAGTIKQAGRSSVKKAASLVQASASFAADNLVVRATTEAQPDPAMYHIYLDTDRSSTTGFHSATAAAGLGGADYLCEGTSLYIWDGSSNQTEWRWRWIASIKASRAGPQELEVTIPLSQLNLRDRKDIQLLFETIDDKWQGEDVIPREGTWSIKLPNSPASSTTR